MHLLAAMFPVTAPATAHHDPPALLPRCPLCPLCSRFQQPIWRWEESNDAVRSYAIFFGILAAGLIPALQVVCRVLPQQLQKSGGRLLRQHIPAGTVSTPSEIECCQLSLVLPTPTLPSPPQENRFAGLPYFWGLASMTIYIRPALY